MADTGKRMTDPTPPPPPPPPPQQQQQGGVRGDFKQTERGPRAVAGKGRRPGGPAPLLPNPAQFLPPPEWIPPPPPLPPTGLISPGPFLPPGHPAGVVDMTSIGVMAHLLVVGDQGVRQPLISTLIRLATTCNVLAWEKARLEARVRELEKGAAGATKGGEKGEGVSAEEAGNVIDSRAPGAAAAEAEALKGAGSPPRRTSFPPPHASNPPGTTLLPSTFTSQLGLKRTRLESLDLSLPLLRPYAPDVTDPTDMSVPGPVLDPVSDPVPDPESDPVPDPVLSEHFASTSDGDPGAAALAGPSSMAYERDPEAGPSVAAFAPDPERPSGSGLHSGTVAPSLAAMWQRPPPSSAGIAASAINDPHGSRGMGRSESLAAEKGGKPWTEAEVAALQAAVASVLDQGEENPGVAVPPTMCTFSWSWTAVAMRLPGRTGIRFHNNCTVWGQERGARTPLAWRGCAHFLMRDDG